MTKMAKSETTKAHDAKPEAKTAKTRANKSNTETRKSSNTKSSSNPFLYFFQSLLFTCALFIIIFACIYLGAFIISLILHLLLGDAVTRPVWTSIYQALAYSLAAFFTIWLTPRLARQLGKLKPLKNLVKSDPLTLTENSTRDQLGLTGLPTWTDVGLAPIAFVAALIVGNVLLAICSFIFPWFDVSEAQEIGYSTTIIGVDRLFAFIAICIVAPVAEELLFRGWLYGKQRVKTGAILATILNATFFGLMHGQLNVALSVGAMGAACCLLREITGTIYSGMILHILKNTIAFLLLFLVF